AAADHVAQIGSGAEGAVAVAQSHHKPVRITADHDVQVAVAVEVHRTGDAFRSYQSVCEDGIAEVTGARAGVEFQVGGAGPVIAVDEIQYPVIIEVPDGHAIRVIGGVTGLTGQDLEAGAVVGVKGPVAVAQQYGDPAHVVIRYHRV